MHFSKRIKSRIRIFILMESLVIALAFGLSFYFGLISTESALASRVPELADVVDKLKTMLISNTIIFAAIIICSFYVLSLLLTNRIFKPLEVLREDLETLADGRLPRERIDLHGGPFESLEEAYRSARRQLEERQRAEIAELTACIETAEPGGAATDRLEKLVKEKKCFFGEKEQSGEKAAQSEDGLFMQPV